MHKDMGQVLVMIHEFVPVQLLLGFAFTLFEVNPVSTQTQSLSGVIMHLHSGGNTCGGVHLCVMQGSKC